MSYLQPNYIRWRFYLVLSLIVLAALVLVGRIVDLVIFDQPFLRHQGDERALRMVNTPALRGMIVDRNGFPLAVSTTVYSAWINPKEFNPSKQEAADLAKILQIKSKEIVSIENANQKKKREFAYIRRGLSPEVSNKLKALSIPGFYLQEEYRRYYPEGEIMAHVLGFTNVDDKGQEGLELTYNNWLQGEPGKKWVAKDRLGRVIATIQTIQEKKPGHDLVLSIDRRIQYLAYRELLAGVQENEAHSGSVVVLDAKTGEVLAMVNQPSFNPNKRPVKMTENIRNRAVTDIFEPGSTAKAFSVAVALASGKFKPNTVIDTYPGWFRVGHNIVKDHESHPFLTVTEVLQKSSNVGVAKMLLTLPPERLWNLLHNVGFGEATGVGFPGEQSGVLVARQRWGQFVYATLSIGYGFSTTTLQLANAYNVLANAGMKKPVSLLKLEKPVTGERVMNGKLAKQILFLLENVVNKGGTAEQAKVEGYRVAGKTGTAVMVGVGGYQKHHYTSSFVGIAPITNPRIVIAVVIHDPRGKHYYGGQVSGPVFQKIMEGTLRILDVPPDAE